MLIQLLTIVITGIVALGHFAPTSPLARQADIFVTLRLIKLLQWFSPGRMVLVIGSIGLLALVMWFGGDAISIFSMSTPEVIGWLVTFDIATLVDVATGAIIAASAVQFGRGRMWMGTVGKRLVIARRRSRSVRSKPTRTVANDEEGRGMLLSA
jgi:hypothetical protein